MPLYGKQRIIGKRTEPASRQEELAYTVWQRMIHMAFDKSHSYAERKNNHVCSRFKDFRAFSAWFAEQQGSDQDKVYINKDLLHPGNRVYNDATCVLLPAEIHDVLEECQLDMKDLEAEYGKITPQMIAVIKDEIGAVLIELANKYRDKLDKRAYNALINYEIQIKGEWQ